MKRFSVWVDAENAEEARELLTLMPNSEIRARMTKVGFVHPDGHARKCDVPPPGHKLIIYGEDCLAVPIVTGEPYSQIHYERSNPTPDGTLFWKNGEWRPPVEP
ncbi:MAG: hypothetical protein A3G47_00540 [Candidatus Zambryskibacteria bacterium RIFCSPLOWO2_12_FULL_39_45]|uniref:Uncharacterized protein n=3 Tax=Candidatus Zambryskiibacteriota TaxID=1817925 RepID=A0A1G2T611_9BACT|nr:MAG: hypothetical protein UT81_C0003G0004 [Parcubacteria group bacterium GW2011_GWA2_40_14]OHA92703.1 MAG: hypothetical protein A2W58_01275 [Candidatus Zambryskibacteria bacterium RIFCSPHIGHO2_02_38_10.5]OHA98406.1 MAG: hypothetical protein A3E32_01815 [Candidatus Zambryskibacteria bacterium RIFCSPHIGHO2_12_FULL_38_37]OHB09174.1 MAG: hypothetical protein A2W64_01380 [Candidatus Zambryskibacteria bacterium RIFCSPLOWO2_02_39_10]OHB10477.1 MAG: hypothetical protein A3I21_01660 [Candidatus Zambr